MVESVVGCGAVEVQAVVVAVPQWMPVDHLPVVMEQVGLGVGAVVNQSEVLIPPELVETRTRPRQQQVPRQMMESEENKQHQQQTEEAVLRTVDVALLGEVVVEEGWLG